MILVRKNVLLLVLSHPRGLQMSESPPRPALTKPAFYGFPVRLAGLYHLRHSRQALLQIDSKCQSRSGQITQTRTFLRFTREDGHAAVKTQLTSRKVHNNSYIIGVNNPSTYLLSKVKAGRKNDEISNLNREKNRPFVVFICRLLLIL